MNHPRILGIGTANPPVRLTQEQSFHAAGYQGERIRKIFLNSDIDRRHFYLEGTLNRRESSDQLNQRYLRGAMKTGCRAILNCLKAAGTTVQDVDFLAVCTCTGYVCPDVGSRLIAHMGFSNNLQRASIVGLGCAAALPPAEESMRTLARLGDFMFRMIIPEQIQKYLRQEGWSFSITTNDLELPWELMCFEGLEPYDKPSNLPHLYLCVERSISRMPLGVVFPPSPSRRGTRPHKRRMLLIHSDPNNTLSKAADEVETIDRDLKDQLDFVRVSPADATNANLNDILITQSFDFIHYAGHAYFDIKFPNESGLQLSDSILTARKIRLLNKGGSLVFLNACDSGTVASDKEPQKVSYLLTNPEPVVGLASAFVYNGALGCVGSLWPVYDTPAAELAVKFYRYVLSGEPTGEALRMARLEIRQSYPDEITWAAYVL